MRETGFQVTFYVHGREKRRGMLLYQWLLREAKELGVHGGTAMRSIAGFGQHRVFEEGFFELGSNVVVEVVFNVTETLWEALYARFSEEKLDLFYTKVAAEFGFLNQ